MMTPEFSRTGAIAVNAPDLTYEDRVKLRNALIEAQTYSRLDDWAKAKYDEAYVIYLKKFGITNPPPSPDSPGGVAAGASGGTVVQGEENIMADKNPVPPPIPEPPATPEPDLTRPLTDEQKRARLDRFVGRVEDLVWSACVSCLRKSRGTVCEAFPRGIPASILNGEVRHTEPYPGDMGLTYLPVMPTTTDTESRP